MAEPSEWAWETARDIFQSDKPYGFVWNSRLCGKIALVLDAARRKGEADERKRCVAILHDEGWLGQSEQRIAHPDLFTEEDPT